MQRSLLLLLLASATVAYWPRPSACGIDPSGRPPEISPHRPSNSTLLQVLLVTRHGDRTISSPTPPACWLQDDARFDCSLTVTEVPSYTASLSMPTPRLYRKKYIAGRELYPGNCMTGQLTSIGYAQHLLNGNALRRTYVDKLGFLPTSFDPKLFYLRSDDVQRTTQSLEALMLGLYPPSGAADATQVIDFHSMDLAIDTMSPSNPVLCPFQSNVTAAQSLSEEWMTHFKSVTTPLYAELANLTGMPLSTMTASHVLDCMRVHLCHGLSLPPWFNMALYERVKEEALWQYRYSYTWPNATIAAQVGIGHLWADLLAQALPAANATARRFVYFSGHDTTVYSLLTSIGLASDLEWPPYASLLLFELWQPHGTSDMDVRIIFNGSVLATLPYDDLAALVAPLLPGDICTTGAPLLF